MDGARWDGMGRDGMYGVRWAGNGDYLLCSLHCAGWRARGTQCRSRPWKAVGGGVFFRFFFFHSFSGFGTWLVAMAIEKQNKNILTCIAFCGFGGKSYVQHVESSSQRRVASIFISGPEVSGGDARFLDRAHAPPITRTWLDCLESQCVSTRQAKAMPCAKIPADVRSTFPAS